MDVKTQIKKRIKPREEKFAIHNVADLELRRSSIVYKRLSSYEQVHTSRFSIERQHLLEAEAINDGYKSALTSEQIKELKESSHYPGYYINGQIIVIELDLGISGTLGQEDRPGLAMLIELIEKDQVESIYLVDISRIFRDDAMTSAPPFAKLCKDHGVIIVAAGMRYDLRNQMHYDFFLQMAKHAGQEIRVMIDRLGQARALKAKMGLYAGGNISAGYFVDFQPKSPTFEQYLPYTPHVPIIEELFKLGQKHNGSTIEVLREARQMGLYFPLFEPGFAATMNTRSALRFSEPKRDSNGNVIGYTFTRGFLYSIFTNPMYIGLPVRSGEIVKEGMVPPIVDQETFMSVYEKISKEQRKRRGPSTKTDPYLLQGLLFSNCKRGSIRPVYFSNYPTVKRKDHPGSHGGFKCGCDEIYPEYGTCFYISAYVIQEPVRDYVLSQISFPDYANEIIKTIQTDYDRSKVRAAAFKNERKRLADEVNNLRANFSLIRLDSSIAEMLQSDIEQRLEKLKELEKREMEAYSEITVTPEDIKLISRFLKDLREQWNNLPPAFQTRLFKLLLSKVVIDALEDGNFYVDVIWKGGLEQRLWIERPTMSSPCKAWTEVEKDLIRKLYTDAPVEEIMKHFPDKNWDAIRTVAKRLGLSRNIRSGCRWTEKDDAVLIKLDRGELTYRQARFELRHHRQGDIYRKMEKLGLKKPDIDVLNWRILGNTQENELFSPG